MTKHKHHNEIVAWAEGARIQHKLWDLHWSYSPRPSWDADTEYRVEPKPNVELTSFVSRWSEINKIDMCSSGDANVKFTFNGETNELIAVEMIK